MNRSTPIDWSKLIGEKVSHSQKQVSNYNL